MVDAAALSEGTTTNTSVGAVIYSVASPINGAQVALLVPFQIHLAHTVASASAQVTLELYNGPLVTDPPAFTIWGTAVNLSPTAGDVTLVSQVAVVLFGPTSWTSGQRLFQVRVRPITAGTLTYGSSVSGAFDRVALFQLGAIVV